MICRVILCMVFLSAMVNTLKLSKPRPSTVWGVQKAFFRASEEDYFKSAFGTYQFQYDTGNSQHQMFRKEKRYSDGTVVGFYGYVDPENTLRITEYIAGRNGYRQRTVLRYPILNDS